MKAEVTVFLKPDVLDTQGRAILRASHRLGFEQVRSVRVGKVMMIELNETGKNKAEETMKALCDTLLSNPVIEHAKYELKD